MSEEKIDRFIEQVLNKMKKDSQFKEHFDTVVLQPLNKEFGEGADRDVLKEYCTTIDRAKNVQEAARTINSIDPDLSDDMISMDINSASTTFSNKMRDDLGVKSSPEKSSPENDEPRAEAGVPRACDPYEETRRAIEEAGIDAIAAYRKGKMAYDNTEYFTVGDGPISVPNDEREPAINTKPRNNDLLASKEEDVFETGHASRILEGKSLEGERKEINPDNKSRRKSEMSLGYR